MGIWWSRGLTIGIEILGKVSEFQCHSCHGLGAIKNSSGGGGEKRPPPVKIGLTMMSKVRQHGLMKMN